MMERDDMFRPIVGARQMQLEAEEALIRESAGSVENVDSVAIIGEVLIESTPVEAPDQAQ